MSLLRDNDQWGLFEQIVRDIIVNALREIPAEECERRSSLKKLYDLSDEDRAAKLKQDFHAIKNTDLKQQVLRILNA